MADQSVIDKLASQILGQGISSQWKGTGHGSAAANARDMATIMAGIGITDVRQFGKVTKTVDAAVQPVFDAVLSDDGQEYISKIVGYTDQDGNPVDPKLVKTETDYGGESGNMTTTYTAPIGKQETFGNKLTGQEVPSTYGERQTGNAWGGTFAGSGNTGYRVQFTNDGTPIFYTTHASSNDLANILADLGPIGQIGLAIATGGLSIPQQIAAQMAIQVLSGADIENVIKNAAVSFITAQIPGTDVMKEANGFIKDLGLSDAVTKTLNTAVQTAVVSGTKAALTNQNISDAMLKGFASGGTNGAVTALLGSMDFFKDLSKTQKRLVSTAVTGVVSGKPLDQVLINTAIAAANTEIAEQRRLNAPLDEKAISELSAEEKAVYDESGTQGLKTYLDSLKTKPPVDDSDSGTGTGTGTETKTDTGTGTGTGTETKTDTVTVTGAQGCLANEYWDPVLESCQTKQIDTTPTNTGTGTGTVTVTACGEGKVRNSAGICEDIDCGDGKYWDPVTKACELKVVETVKVDDKGTDKGTVTVTACGEGKVRNAAGDCVDIDCGEGKYWDPITKACELKKVETLVCGANEEKSPDGLSCLPKCGTGYKRGPDGITCVKDDVVTVTACGEGKVRNAAGDCVDIDCGEGKYWDPITKACELKKVETVDVKGDGTDVITVTACAPGKVRNAAGICEDIDCGDGKYWDPITKQCEIRKVDVVTPLTCGANEEKSPDGLSCLPKCGTGFKRGADGISCVPITTTTTPPVVVKPPITTTAPTIAPTIPTAIVSTETTSPIYAGAMGNFDLFATLPELLADDTGKKDTKKPKDTTKMATGGHLDDLLAERMTVDDLLNLLR